MQEEGSLARACSDVAAAMASPETGQDVVRKIAARAADVLRVVSAGVVLDVADGPSGVAIATDSLVADLYAVETEIGEGPAHDARRRREPVPVPSLIDAGRRWRRWTEEARVHEVGAWLVVPSRTERRPALLLAAGGNPRQWTEEDLLTAQVLADLAAGCAAWDAQLDRTRQVVDQLQEALDHRVVIEQAKGLLAGELGCSLDTAFDVLRDQARARSVTVRSVAHAVVHLGLRPPAPAPGPGQALD